MKEPLFPLPAVIGMVHFSPLEGDPNFEGEAVTLARAKADVDALLAGGVDTILFENNFDSPKFAALPPLAAAHFERLVSVLASSLRVPWGVVPLWNDYELGFRLCKVYGGKMVRVPVFVDAVKTVYGTFEADPGRVIRARREAGAEDVWIIADVQVKHAELVHPRPFVDSLRESVEARADAVIVTGKWTGDPPLVEQCAEARAVAKGKAYVFTGSGMTAQNISSYVPNLDGYIVGTAFKEGDVNLAVKDGPNIVGPARRYDVEKIKKFVEVANILRHADSLHRSIL